MIALLFQFSFGFSTELDICMASEYANMSTPSDHLPSWFTRKIDSLVGFVETYKLHEVASAFLKTGQQCCSPYL